MTTHDFRNFLPDPNIARFTSVRGMDACAYAESLLATRPAARDLFAAGALLLEAPFTGVTSNGSIEPGLFDLAEEDAPVAAMASATEHLLSSITPLQRFALVHDINAREWRSWANPEPYVCRFGLRLEELAEPVVAAIHDIVRASLSPQGYEKIRHVMRMNAFLGDLVQLPRIMNERSYNFILFGTPSPTAPWGWNIYGHHLAINCFVLGSQMVVTPTFMGAEPNYFDTGPHAGVAIFADQERLGLELIRSLPAAQRAQAQTFDHIRHPDMPACRCHPADQLMLGGAFQDNRVIPYEGIPASEFDGPARARLMALFASFLDFMPAGPLAARLKAIEQMLDDCWFNWIGGFGDDDAFYYRLHSPVIMIEFDHHSGVFLTNAQPSKCHTHTVIRTPNGNDYGKQLLKLHQARAPD